MSILDAHQSPAITSLLFGDFELQLSSGELFRSGTPVKLQPRPAQVLAVLALRAGEAVSREEIRSAVWGEESHLDFDVSLNYCIRQIRLALDDSAEEPRFIATLPRVGYRFLAPVEVRRPEPAPAAVPASRSRGVLWRQIAVAAIALLLVLILVALRSRGNRPRTIVRAAAPAASEEARQAWANLEAHYLAVTGDLNKAGEAFRETDPGPRSALAWATLAHDVLKVDSLGREVAPSLEVAERQALALDPNLALAHLDRAVRLFRFEYDWRESEREFRRALELDPHLDETHYMYARLLTAQGRHDEALEQARQAQLTVTATQPLVAAQRPWLLYLARRYDEAIAQARREIALVPPGTTSETNTTDLDLYLAFRTILLATLAKGDRGPAAFEAARAEAHWLDEPEPRSLDDYWLTKRDAYAKAGSGRPWSRTVVAIQTGDRELAMDLLFDQCRKRLDSMIPFLRVDPLYDSLHSHPRFQELLRCAHLEDGPG